MQRATVIGAAVATLALLGALVYYSSQPEYRVLFSELKSSDAQTIIEKLKTENVPYKLANNGSTISVPIERVTELRLQLAADGTLSGGHVGFDIFDKSNFGATDFAQRVNFQRALEGEIARTLEGMDEVESARVHITPARESVFTEKGEPAKASVVLRMRQKRDLTRDRAEGVRNLMASAVEGLDPANVSVLDAQGRVLSPSSKDQDNPLTGPGGFNAQMQARQQLEANTAARVVALLEPIVGVGHVRAEVTADLDFSQIDQTAEKFDPKSSVIRTQQTLQETRNSKLPAAGGVVGARANDPQTPTPAEATPSPSPGMLGDQRSSQTTNYEIDKTVTHTTDGGGRLQRLSVSVAVDDIIKDGKSVPRSAEELKKLQELVTAATGINADRGDQIVVQTLSFNQPNPDAPPPFLERYRELIQMAIKYGALVLAIVLVLLFLVRPARKALLEAAMPPPEPLLLAAAPGVDGAVGLTVGEAINGGETGALPAADENALSADEEAERAMHELALPAAGGESMEAKELASAVNVTTPMTVAELEEEIARQLNSPVPEVKRALALKKQLMEQGLNDPETLAMTVRGWLQEKKEPV